MNSFRPTLSLSRVIGCGMTKLSMILGTGSIEWGSKRSLLEKFDYEPGNLAICERHIGEWVGLVNVPHLHLGISDAALMASSDGACGEAASRPSSTLRRSFVTFVKLARQSIARIFCALKRLGLL